MRNLIRIQNVSGAVKNLLPTNALRGFVASNAMIMHTKQKKGN